MNKWQIYRVGAVALGFAVTIVHAESYKWVDEDGEVHYSQTPPKHGKVTTVAPPPPPAIPPQQAVQALQKQQQKLQEIRAQRSQSAQQEQQTKQQLAAMQRNCDRAKTTLAGLSAGGNRLYKDKEGNVTRLDEQARQANIKNAQQMIQKNCK